MIPKCEFGDCDNAVSCTQKFNKIEFAVCQVHREVVYEMVGALVTEWVIAKSKIGLKFIKAMREGGKEIA